MLLTKRFYRYGPNQLPKFAGQYAIKLSFILNLEFKTITMKANLNSKTNLLLDFIIKTDDSSSTQVVSESIYSNFLN
jgi:hypothetical protein